MHTVDYSLTFHLFLRNLQTSFHAAALQPLILQYVCISMVVASHIQYLSLAIVKLHVVGDCPAFQYFKTSQQDLSSLMGVNSPSQFNIHPQF